MLLSLLLLLLEMLILHCAAAHQVADDNPSLAFVVVFKSDHDHPVAFWTASPTVVAVFLAYFSRRYEFEVAVCTHIVVAMVAFDTVESCCGGGDWIGADIAVSGE